ncbi:MAG: bifunctional phosphoserine phosphatase/homoserine phosphotransferase ThrH, partial [Desulfobacterales bacterium]
MYIVCADMEGIFTPEIWINVAERTGIEELKLTTRDISDYDVLMNKRLAILDKNGLKLQDIQAVISEMDPLEGALDFLNWLRSQLQVVIVSDTYVEFA